MAADENLTIGLEHESRLASVQKGQRPKVHLKRCVCRAVGIQARQILLRDAVHSDERSFHQNFSVRLKNSPLNSVYVVKARSVETHIWRTLGTQSQKAHPTVVIEEEDFD